MLWYLKVDLLKLHMCVYLCTQFKVSSIILTSFREREREREREDGKKFYPSSTLEKTPRKTAQIISNGHLSCFEMSIHCLDTFDQKI